LPCVLRGIAPYTQGAKLTQQGVSVGAPPAPNPFGRLDRARGEQAIYLAAGSLNFGSDTARFPNKIEILCGHSPFSGIDV
jgi:hypothetical protein